jgi:hypothetical protein
MLSIYTAYIWRISDGGVNRSPHEDDIIIRTAAFPLVIRVHIRKERTEGIPVDQRGDFTQGVPECRELGVFVSNCKIEEGTH